MNLTKPITAVLAAVAMSMAVQIAIAARVDYPWGSARPDAARTIRNESPRMTRQPADTGHLMPLYEAWMIEVFCARRANQRQFGNSRADCIRGVGGEPAARCSAKLRERVPKAYSDGVSEAETKPGRHTFTGFIKAYQACLRRNTGPSHAGRS